MIFVLDTTEFVSHRFDLDSPDFRLLMSARQNLDLECVIPEIVIREVENKFFYRVNELAARIRKEVLALHRLSGVEFSGTPSVQAIRKAFKNFRKRFQIWREDIECEEPGLEAIKIDRLVRRALKGRKPFSPTGSGMRDALIW